ncbi:hypothetical protein L208DRAFT_1402257 [Tricholoma matsutake]|nr:hypothetical protein L208DRAFT_1402257 [Tricholoma matsutake 945]
MAMWGMLFQFQLAMGMMSPLGFAFATCSEGKGDGWKTGPSSPTSAKSLLLKTISSSVPMCLHFFYMFANSESFDVVAIATHCDTKIVLNLTL